MPRNPELPKFGPLSDVKVVHADSSLAGPFAAQMMADFGADVTWVENSKVPDLMRMTPVMLISQERRNQRDLGLNLGTPEGRDVLLKLLEDTDIFIEASKGGQYDAWGLTDEVLWEHNPKLVIIHISGFGQTGVPEYVHRPSFDPIAQAFAGTMYFNGFADRPPVAIQSYFADYTTAMHAAFIAMACLHNVEKTGKGESVDLAQYEALLRNCLPLVEYRTDGRQIKPMGNEHALAYANGTYTCGDGGNIFLCISGAAAFKHFLPLIGMEYGDEYFPEGTTFALRGTPGGDEFEKRLREYVASKSVDEVSEELTKLGVPCQKVNTFKDVVNNPHVQARDIFADWTDFDGNEIKGIGIIPKLKNNPGRVWRAAPKMGMDNEPILHEMGYTDEQIADMYEKGTIGKKLDGNVVGRKARFEGDY